MSRSYRKYPCPKDRSKYGKRCAARRVRRAKDEIGNGSKFKRVFNTYDIMEFTWYKSFEAYLDDLVRMGCERPTTPAELKRARYEWYKVYKQK